MSTKQPIVLVVRKNSDIFSKLFSKELHLKEIRVKEISPEFLGNFILSLKKEHLMIKGHPVIGILFRAFPNSTFTKNYIYQDRNFCDDEIRATLLAVLNLDSILVINKYDAIAWFEGINWPIWRRRFSDAGLSISRFIFGDVNIEGRWLWYPYKMLIPYSPPNKVTRRFLGCALTPNVKMQKNLIVCNEIISGEKKLSIIAASHLLMKFGIHIAELISNQEGSIVTINTQPKITNKEIAKKATQVLFKWFYENLYNR